MPQRTLIPRSKTGLFSATVAALVAVSVQDLKPNSQDISAFYLANIYQILADSNGSQVIIPPTLPNPSIPFSPPTSAVWVNSLWFLSLVISLTCGLLGTSVQQWARRYMKATHKRYSPHRMARIRAFFAEGIEKRYLPWTIEALPALLHLSLFLFFAGLAVFLFNINHTVFNVAISWVGLCTGVYICITFMPIFRHDSPYYSPLSSSAWYLCTRSLFKLFRILERIANQYNPSYSIWKRLHDLRETYRKRTSWGMERDLEETALKAPSEIDRRALMWMYRSLYNDHDLEQFFSGIPGFCSSMGVDSPQSSLDGLRSWKVAEALYGLLERTLSSNLVSGEIKIRRVVICIRAIDAAHLSDAAERILDTFFEHRSKLFRSVELGHSLMSWGNNNDRKNTLFSQGIIACIIALTEAPQHNETWNSLTMHQLGIPKHVLQSYLNRGDSVLLATLIHFTREFVRNPPKEDSFERLPLLPIISRLGMDFKVQDTLPELQHDFCGLWNEIVQQTRHGDHFLLRNVLGEIRLIYLALHQGSTQHHRYPSCSIPSGSHHIDSASIPKEKNTAKGTAPATATLVQQADLPPSASSLPHSGSPPPAHMPAAKCAHMQVTPAPIATGSNVALSQLPPPM